MDLSAADRAEVVRRAAGCQSSVLSATAPCPLSTPNRPRQSPLPARLSNVCFPA